MMNHAAGGDVTLGHYVGKSEAQLRAGWQAVADFVEGRRKGVTWMSTFADSRRSGFRSPCLDLPFALNHRVADVWRTPGFGQQQTVIEWSASSLSRQGTAKVTRGLPGPSAWASPALSVMRPIRV